MQKPARPLLLSNRRQLLKMPAPVALAPPGLAQKYLPTNLRKQRRVQMGDRAAKARRAGDAHGRALKMPARCLVLAPQPAA